MERRVQRRTLFLSRKNKLGVAIGFYGSKTIEQTNKISNKSGRILLVEVTIDDTIFVLIKIYNASTELEQLDTFSDLVSILDKVKDIQNKKKVLGGNLNVTFDISLENLGGNSCFKKKSLAKCFKLKKKIYVTY